MSNISKYDFNYALYTMLYEYAQEMVEDGRQRDRVSIEQLRSIFTTLCLSAGIEPDTATFDGLCAQMRSAVGLTQAGSEDFFCKYLV